MGRRAWPKRIRSEHRSGRHIQVLFVPEVRR
nr:MAG TPA: hypothetical protein [Bacteriophage sp.]